MTLRIWCIALMLVLFSAPAWAGENRIQGDPIVIGSGNLILGDSDTDGTLRWYDDDGEYFTIDAADMATDFAFVWPADDGTASQVLQTDGSGNLTWASVVAPEAGTANGQMLFWDTDTWKHTETTELYWDDTDKELGVGIATPAAPLHVFDATNEDLVWLEYENGDSSGATMQFFKDSVSPADHDVISEIIYWGRDDGANSNSTRRSSPIQTMYPAAPRMAVWASRLKLTARTATSGISTTPKCASMTVAWTWTSQSRARTM